MNITLEDVVNNSFVISIDDKRLEFFYNQWEKHGLPGRPKHVVGIQLSKNFLAKSFSAPDLTKKYISIMYSHLMIVTMARAMNLPFVCIFEDDAIACNNVEERLRERLSDIPDDTDILALGNCTLFGVKEDVGNGLIVPTLSYGLQSYIVFQKNYDNFINRAQERFAGICGWGKNLYLAKDIIFCQYRAAVPTPESVQNQNVNRGFYHAQLPREYIYNNFQIM